MWGQWDAGWYINLASNGYSNGTTAFFPLYSFLIKLISPVFGLEISGYIISNISFLLASIYLYKLISLDYNKDISFKTVFFMLIFPASFFSSLVYTEGLFLLLSISCIYFARERKWITSSILGFFTSLTKPIGFLIMIPVLIEYFKLDFNNIKIDFKKIKLEIISIALIPLGLLSYMTYQKIRFGSFLSFIASEKNWNREITSILDTIRNVEIYPQFYQIVFIGSVILTTILIGYLFVKKVRMSYLAYSIIIFLAFLSTSLLEGIPRYISIIPFIYLGMALLSEKNKIVEYILIISCSMILMLFLVLFVNGYWTI
jgi:Gpi18-like mannosyltransferase